MKNITEINTETEEGKLLVAALAKLTVESQLDKTPDDVLQQITILKRQIYPTNNSEEKCFIFKRKHETVLAILGVSFTKERKSGNTTRIVDNIIQKLYEGYKIEYCEFDENGYISKEQIRISHLQEVVHARLKLINDGELPKFNVNNYKYIELK